METLFSKIIAGEIPSYKVAEDSNCFAFLDINPNTKGHVLCVPKVVRDKFFDLDEATFNQLMTFSRKVALAIRIAIPCERIGMSVIGLEVPLDLVVKPGEKILEAISFFIPKPVSEINIST